MTEQDFKIIPEELCFLKMGITLPEWRHNYIRRLVGDIYDCGGGQFTIEFPNGFSKTLKTKNFAKRLDNIFYQLMAASDKSCDDVWIQKIKEGRHPYTTKEIRELKIHFVKEDTCIIFIDWKNKVKQYPRSAGVYIMTFPNGKKYLGQTNNFQKRFEGHFSGLFGDRKSEGMSWYSKCLEDNPQLKPEDIEIECIPTGSRKALEKEMLSQIEDRTEYYNCSYPSI